MYTHTQQTNTLLSYDLYCFSTFYVLWIKLCLLISVPIKFDEMKFFCLNNGIEKKCLLQNIQFMLSLVSFSSIILFAWHFVLGHFIQGTFCPWVILSLRHFIHGTFCPVDILSWDIFYRGTFCPRTFYPGKFCLGDILTWKILSKGHFVRGKFRPRYILSAAEWFTLSLI